MNKILVVIPVTDEHVKLFTQAAPSAQFIFTYGKQPSKEQVLEADTVIGNVPPAWLTESTNLKWVQLNSAGTDGYTGKGVLPKDVVLTNATGAYGVAISEHMIAGLLSLMKKLFTYEKDQDAHVWSDRGPVASIYGSKTLVVGLGNIGGEFAKRMNAFGSEITGIKRNTSNVPGYAAGVYTPDKLIECLKDADIVANCLPGVEETRRLYDKDAFAAMKEGAYFINIGRGMSVDSDALAEALNSGHLAGAVIDVTDPEPLPADHPLWNAKNLVLTPHVSGGYHTKETHDRIVKIAVSNIEKYLNNEPLMNVISR